MFEEECRSLCRQGARKGEHWETRSETVPSRELCKPGQDVCLVFILRPVESHKRTLSRGVTLYKLYFRISGLAALCRERKKL